MDRFTLGMLIDYCRVYNDIQNGNTDKPNENKQYKKLKSIEPLVDEKYQKGKISKQKYEEFKKSIKKYEEVN